VVKAKQLLASAGYPNGISFPMTIIANNISAQQGELLALQLRQAGINVNLQTVDVGTFLDQVLNKSNFVSGVVAAASPTILSTNFANGRGWFTNWNNATFDGDIAKADVAASPKAANALYSAAAKLLAADAPIVPLYNDVNLTIRPKNLKGWVPFRIDQAIDVRRVRWAG
jgi:peptide/nickel transport system substrate-binding protein